MRAAEQLSAADARRLLLHAQGFLGAPDRRGGVPAMLRRLHAVQLDTISVLARSHELVAYARLGPVGRATVEAAYWGEPHRAVEYWAHVASIIPIEDWPWFASRRGRYRTAQWHRSASDATYARVRARLAEGPVTTADVGGAKNGGQWWDWSEAKIALERMVAKGEVVCVERRGWRRVYDLAERAIPAELLALEPSPEECNVELVRRAAQALGVATRRDLADYYRLKLEWVDAAVAGAGLVPVEVQGWDEPAWALPSVLTAGPPPGRHRTTLLSPFDSLVWDRGRTERVFGMSHRLEAYTPRHKRVYGYFAMPVLVGGRLVARVDPKRAGRTLLAQNVAMAARPTEAVLAGVAGALLEAAAWVGCDSVVVERTDLSDAEAQLLALRLKVG
ncbi:MAG TPA: crosslink repair DNA glycosylase YcaQ family protein [Acidimicrobiales bacterium]|nr:crosslink repair DNA glycosylase YcaQ family protein [Acidimicrobiales bacterium]